MKNKSLLLLLHPFSLVIPLPKSIRSIDYCTNSLMSGSISSLTLTFVFKCFDYAVSFMFVYEF